MRSFGPDCARGLDVRTQKSSSPVASVSGATGTSKEAGPQQPGQCGDLGTRSRALTTLVEAVHNAPADVGSIPTVSTFGHCALTGSAATVPTLPREQPCEVVRRHFDSFGQGGLEAAAQLWHPQIEWRAVEG